MVGRRDGAPPGKSCCCWGGGCNDEGGPPLLVGTKTTTSTTRRINPRDNNTASTILAVRERWVTLVAPFASHLWVANDCCCPCGSSNEGRTSWDMLFSAFSGRASPAISSALSLAERWPTREGGECGGKGWTAEIDGRCENTRGD